MATLENIINRIIYSDHSEQSFSLSILTAIGGILSLALASTIIQEQNFSSFIIRLFFLTIVFLFLATIYLPATSIYWLKNLTYRQVIACFNWQLATLALTLPVAIICRVIHLRLFYSLFIWGFFLVLFWRIIGDISFLTQKKPAIILITFLLPLLVMFSITGALLIFGLLIIGLTF